MIARAIGAPMRSRAKIRAMRHLPSRLRRTGARAPSLSMRNRRDGFAAPRGPQRTQTFTSYSAAVPSGLMMRMR